MEVKIGKYQHYKGVLYEVEGVGLYEQDETPVVIYRALYENPKSVLWVRSVQSFLEIVNTEQGPTPRFKQV